MYVVYVLMSILDSTCANTVNHVSYEYCGRRREKSVVIVRTCVGGSPSTPARSRRGRTADASRAPRAPGGRPLASATCTSTCAPHDPRTRRRMQCSPLSALIMHGSTQHSTRAFNERRRRRRQAHSSSATHLIVRAPTHAESPIGRLNY